jgi:serine protease
MLPQPRQITFVLAGALLIAACSDSSAPVGPEGLSAARSSTGPGDRLIVIFNDGVTDVPGLARRLAVEHGGTLHFTYERAIRGFAASFPATALDGLRRNPHVAYIEPDAVVELHGTQANPPSWGIDRIDQADLPLNQSYTYPNTGAGVNVYVLDTGVRLTHNDFGGRARYVSGGVGGNFVGDARANAEDCHGHGTHVAGTAAGSSFGVAKAANIWAARVVDCNGSGNVSMAIAAVDWVTANAIRPAVVNMSLGYGDVQSLRTAVENSVAAGVVYAVSAGNGDFLGRPLDACSGSPAGAPNALTVGATTSGDAESSFSNYGTCVDILAPGSSIVSAYYTSNTATATMSGTSMSSPHVAGAAALYLGANPSATPAALMTALKSNGIVGTITLHSRSVSGGTANRFLNVSFIGGGTPPANVAPTANFTFSCGGLACTFADASSDIDGTIVSRSWNFGDGTTSTATNPSKTYSAGGNYTVTLTVTDDDGAPDGETKTVSVSATGTGITLSATGQKVRGVRTANLSWSGATGSNVDIERNGAFLRSTLNDGTETDTAGKGGGSLTYRICLTGTSTCSNPVTLAF